MRAYPSSPPCWLHFSWIPALFGEEDKWWVLKSSFPFILVTRCISTHLTLYAAPKSCTEFGIGYSLTDNDGVSASCLLYLLYIVVTGKILLLKPGNWGLAWFKIKTLYIFSDFQYSSFAPRAFIVGFDIYWHLLSSSKVQTMTWPITSMTWELGKGWAVSNCFRTIYIMNELMVALRTGCETKCWCRYQSLFTNPSGFCHTHYAEQINNHREVCLWKYFKSMYVIDTATLAPLLNCSSDPEPSLIIRCLHLLSCTFWDVNYSCLCGRMLRSSIMLLTFQVIV